MSILSALPLKINNAICIYFYQNFQKGPTERAEETTEEKLQEKIKELENEILDKNKVKIIKLLLMIV